MAFDMSQFHEVFFAEAGEELARFETRLGRIDLVRPAPDEVADLFRCVHSIKGGSATFGFDDVTRLARVTETLLDAVRKNRLALDRVIVDACLVAAAVLRQQLAAHREGEGGDGAAAEAIACRLHALVEGASQPGREADGEVRAPAPDGGRIERMLGFVDELAAAWAKLQIVSEELAPPVRESVAGDLVRLDHDIRRLHDSVTRLRQPAPAGEARDSRPADQPIAQPRHRARARRAAVVERGAVPSPGAPKSAKMPPLRRACAQPLPKVGRGRTSGDRLEDEWEDFGK